MIKFGNVGLLLGVGHNLLELSYNIESDLMIRKNSQCRDHPVSPGGILIIEFESYLQRWCGS